MTQIQRCKVENILGVKEVEFAPNGQSVTIGGANGQGKTSAIWALIMALGGRGELPPEPVRKGAESGAVVVELDKFTVYLEVDVDKKTKLRVENKDGARYPSPQKMLDELFGNLAFDPGAFKLLDREKRFKVLSELVKVDLSVYDAEYQRAYEERTIIGRRVKELEGKLAGRVKHEGVPEEEVSIADLTKALEAARNEYSTIASGLDRIQQLRNCAQRAAATKERIMGEIEKLQEQVRQVMAEEEEHGKALMAASAAMGGQSLEAAEAKGKEIAMQISSADSTNRKVRENKDLEQLRFSLQAEQDKYTEMDDCIEQVKKDKQNDLAKAPFPIEGLSFEGNGVTYKGVPFEQLSESEQWEISTAIGFALNPKGIVFMRSAGGLDKRSRQRVRERAQALGVQLFIEMVDDAEDVSVLIEEGRVKEDRISEGGKHA